MGTNNRPQELRNTVDKLVQLLEDTAQVLAAVPAGDEQSAIIQDKIWATNAVKTHLKVLLNQQTDAPTNASIFLFGAYNPYELRIYKTILGNWNLDMKRYYCRGKCTGCELSNLCAHASSAYNNLLVYLGEKKKEVAPV